MFQQVATAFLIAFIFDHLLVDKKTRNTFVIGNATAEQHSSADVNSSSVQQ